MRKIIGGRLLDTETAKRIGRSGNRILYQTETGFYFFHDISSDMIIAATYQRARHWAQAKLPTPICRLHFASSDALDLIVPLEAEAYKKLKNACTETGEEPGTLINRLILSQLKK